MRRIYSFELRFLKNIGLLRPFLVVLAGSILTACSTIKLVPENEYLLDKVSLDVDTRQISRDELYSYVKQKPNRKMLKVVPFHLAVYNFAHFGKERKWKKWLGNVIGEEPVIYDPSLKYRTQSQLTIYLHNKGYFDAVVSDSVRFFNKKAHVFYSIHAGKPFSVFTIDYQIADTFLAPFIYEDAPNTLLSPKMLLDVDKLENERIRLARVLRNNGYFYFTKDYIRYNADTLDKDHEVDLYIQVLNHLSKDSLGNIVESNHKKYRINNIYFYTDYDPDAALESDGVYYERFDTLFYKGFYFVYKHKLKVKPEILLMANNLVPDQMFSQKDLDATYRFLNSLKIFRLINIQFFEVDAKFGENKLDCHVLLTSFSKQSYSIDAESNTSSGNIGIEGNLNYQNRNLTGGAEVLDVTLKGALRWQQEAEDKTQDFKFNTVEYGVDASLELPKFLLPFNAYRFYKKYNPKTVISSAYNHQQRPIFTRRLANASFGYFWDASAFSRHQVTPIQFNTVKIFELSDAFKTQIQSSYLVNSFKDFFISEVGYTYTFRNQNINKPTNYVFFRTNLSTGGNFLSFYNSAISKTSNSLDSVHTIFGLEYAQFALADVDFRYYHILNSRNTLVYRFYTGAGIPYGNSTALPFVKQFFSGGANSLRGWQVSTLGPGSYVDTLQSYNQTADFKMEANIEYRFDVFWILKGALFVDVGNIWSLNPKDTRPGVLFGFDTFHKQLAVSTGLGTRVDLKFFIFRIDVGFKAHDPSYPEGERWILGTKVPGKNDFGVNLGIGYPF